MDLEVGTVTPDLARGQLNCKQLLQQYPPRRLMAAALDAKFGTEEQSSQGYGGRNSTAGWGGVVPPLTSGPLVPYNLHECCLYICIYVYMYMQVRPDPPPLATPEWEVGSTCGVPPPPLCKVCNGRDVIFYCAGYLHIAHGSFPVLFSCGCRLESVFCCGCQEA